jgi:hypothetical protein
MNKKHEPGSIEDCECLACSEQAHRESYDMILRERDELWKALAFYADRKNYDQFGVPRIKHEGHPGCKVPDMGRTARIVLRSSAFPAIPDPDERRLTWTALDELETELATVKAELGLKAGLLEGPAGSLAREAELRAQLAAARKALERCQKLERLAALLGAAWFYGGFKAETANEREQEILMEDLGYVFGSENELISALNGDTND